MTDADYINAVRILSYAIPAAIGAIGVFCLRIIRKRSKR